MHKVSRTLLVAGVMAFGTLAAACGDKVEIVQPTTTTGVTAISVTPQSATLNVGQTIQLAVSVTADAATVKTVTWTTSNAAVATVDQTGKVTAVTAGTASIIATSTANTSMASAAAITVTGSANTPNTVAISTVNQTIGGVSAPANLANIAGQVDVTLFISGPAGTLNLIQNCATGANAGVDVIVAQQNVAGSQNQSPVTLSYNTAATGTVNATSKVAVVDNAAATPIATNGNCTLKAQLGTATAANLTPITLNNANFFRSAITYTKTTPVAFSAAQNAISAANGLRYDQGDLNVSVTPVVYTTATGSTSAQVPALATITLTGAAKTITNIALAAGKFTATFPSTGATAANINEYTTTAAGGDQVIISGLSDAAGNNITIGQPIANAVCSSAVQCVITPIRIDNGSPTVTTVSTGFGTLAQALNLFTSARNYINGAYSFSGNVTQQGDVAFANSQMTTKFYVGAIANSGTGGVAPALNAQSVTETSTSCSITGLKQVSTGAELAQTLAPFAPDNFVRVIETDPLGNAVCQDFGVTNGIAGFGVDLQAPTTPAITGSTNGAGNAGNTVITTTASNTYNSVDSVSGFNPNAELRTTVVRNFTTNSNSTGQCVVGAFSATASVCNPVSTGFTVNIDNSTNVQGYYTITTQARDQAGNLSAATVRNYLLDSTIPTVGGVSIPQTLTGGASVTFSSQANDNVDLQASNFSLLYSAASGNASLYYQGDNYGPNYDATRITTAPINATVPFFIKQLQGETAGGAPVAFAAGVGADSGKAASVTVRVIDAANLQSAPVAAAIPPINIANSTGFTTQFATFLATTGATNVSNASTPGTSTTTATLTAQAVFNGATAQQQNLPFSQVCFFYQQTAAGNTANPFIPTGDLVSLGCTVNPGITDVANTSRTWTYTLGTAFNPPAELGTAGTINVYAVGINAAGVGIITPANANITLIP